MYDLFDRFVVNVRTVYADLIVVNAFDLADENYLFYEGHIGVSLCSI